MTPRMHDPGDAQKARNQDLTPGDVTPVDDDSWECDATEPGLDANVPPSGSGRMAAWSHGMLEIEASLGVTTTCVTLTRCVFCPGIASIQAAMPGSRFHSVAVGR